ncbi:unnamed protein product [Lota lota]
MPLSRGPASCPGPHTTAFSFQHDNAMQPWGPSLGEGAPVSSFLTSASAGRWQSHIKVSEGPKVPVSRR